MEIIRRNRANGALLRAVPLTVNVNSKIIRVDPGHLSFGQFLLEMPESFPLHLAKMAQAKSAIILA
jgi:hypothetical protein